jgi:hypothetical protein
MKELSGIDFCSFPQRLRGRQELEIKEWVNFCTVLRGNCRFVEFSVNINITLFWNVTPCTLMFTEVSEERTASMFKVGEYMLPYNLRSHSPESHSPSLLPYIRRLSYVSLYPEDGVRTLPWNVGKHLTGCTASVLRRR